MAVERLLRCYPQADAKASTEFISELTKCLATLTTKELGWVLDPADGVHTRTRFMPTPADVMELVREKRKALEFVAPGTGGYRKLQPGDEIVQPPGDVRKAQVLAALGYDPSVPEHLRHRPRELTPATAADMEALGKTLKLKQPTVSDASPQLKALLMQPEEERLT